MRRILEKGMNLRRRVVKRIAVSVAMICVTFVVAEGQEKAPVSPSSPGKPVASRTVGSIDGQVTDDSGKPVADAAVGVGRVGGGTRETGAITDAEGRFRVKDLASGAYFIGARTPGYVQSADAMVRPDGLMKFYRPGETANITLVKGGVITGTVTDQSGDPVVGVGVTAISIAFSDDLGGSLGVSFGNTRPTDDRGIYRIYGLRGGKYLVYAGAGRGYSFYASPFDRDAPTYYPSSTRDTASVLNVQTGQELTGIDIRYRGDRGYEISGTIIGSAAKFVQLALMTPGNPTPVGSSYAREQDGRMSFTFLNATNGDYKIVAYGGNDKDKQRSIGTAGVSVRNTDATGIVVRLAPLSSAAGLYLLTEPPDSKCEKRSSPGLDQIVAAAIPEKKLTDDPFFDYQNQTTAATNGEFQISDLSNGNYRLRTYLPAEDWYIKSISRLSSRTPAETQAAKPLATPAESIVLGNGEGLSNVMLNLSTGGGAITGQIAAEQTAAATAFPNRMYLIPSEKERADDTLRYADAPINSDGAFSFQNLAPGRYFLLSKVANETENPARPLAWDPKERAKLLHDADTLGAPVEIKPCQAMRNLKASIGSNGSIKITGN